MQKFWSRLTRPCLLLAAVVLGSFAASVPAFAAARVISAPFQASLSSLGTAACLDDPAAATTTGLALTQAPCALPAEQSFAFLPQLDGSLIIHAPGSYNLCMDLNDLGALVQNYCLPTASQKWLPQVNADGSSSLINEQKNLCLSALVTGFATSACSPGTTMQEFSFLNSQPFTAPLRPVKPTPPVAPLPSPTIGQWQAGMFQGLPYRILFPVGYDPTHYVYSMALFLSGAGELGTDNVLQLRNDMAALAFDLDFRAKAPMILVAPQCPKTDTWGNPTSPVPTATEALTVQLVQALTASLPVDPTRISVTGLSLGGIGTWDMINRYPVTFAAAAPLAGAGSILEAPNLVKVPLLAVHGGADTVISPADDEAMYAAIHAKGGPMIYIEAAGVGHDVWDGVYPLTSFWQWMMAQVHI